MKRYRSILMMLAMVLALAACGAPAGGISAAAGADREDASAALDSEMPRPEVSEENDCGHQLAQEDGTAGHEMVGYCGNTVTTVSREEQAWHEPWEASFWGNDSVALTDLLLNLDYSGGVCRCPAEYHVDTEFGSGYGISLTESYVRHDGGQAALTEEETEQIREILERQGAPDIPAG